MKKIVFILFFVCSFAQSQVIIDSYRFDAGADPFFVNNAVTPTPDEEADIDGWTKNGETGSFTLSLESTTTQEGSYALRMTCDTDIVSAARAFLTFTGLENGSSYTVTAYLKEGTGDSVNFWGQLNSADGWVSTQTSGLQSNQSYTQISLTGTTDDTTAIFRVYSTSSFDATEYILIDNVTITKN